MLCAMVIKFLAHHILQLQRKGKVCKPASLAELDKSSTRLAPGKQSCAHLGLRDVEACLHGEGVAEGHVCRVSGQLHDQVSAALVQPVAVRLVHVRFGRRERCLRCKTVQRLIPGGWA